MKLHLRSFALTLFLAAFSAPLFAASPCASPEHRGMDFWAGDWDVFDVDTPNVKAAHARIELILDKCVLHEDYQQVDGFHGESYSIYDASRKVWRQSWVTNRGTMQIVEGNLESGVMTLSGSERTKEGKTQLVRVVWKVEKDGVRETAVFSADDGKTWNPRFDMIFRPAAQAKSASPENGESAIAALDDQYQAAVKANDAVTMDHLLTDNFTLVTGSGKTYSKKDLLEEARAGRIQYVHQEDSNRSVRVLGDTAVVTAQLHAQGTDSGKPFDYTVWFSDTYVRTSAGWRYSFGQSSLPMNADPRTTASIR